MLKTIENPVMDIISLLTNVLPDTNSLCNQLRSTLCFIREARFRTEIDRFMLSKHCDEILYKIYSIRSQIKSSYLKTLVTFIPADTCRKEIERVNVEGNTLLNIIAQMTNGILEAIASKRLTIAIYKFYNFLNGGSDQNTTETIVQKLDIFNQKIEGLKKKLEDFSEQACQIAKKVDNGCTKFCLGVANFKYSMCKAAYNLKKIFKKNDYAQMCELELINKYNEREYNQIIKRINSPYIENTHTCTTNETATPTDKIKQNTIPYDKQPAIIALSNKENACHALSFDIHAKYIPYLCHICIVKFIDGSYTICAWMGDNIDNIKEMVEFEYNNNNELIDKCNCTKNSQTRTKLQTIINNINDIFITSDINKDIKAFYRKSITDDSWINFEISKQKIPKNKEKRNHEENNDWYPLQIAIDTLYMARCKDGKISHRIPKASKKLHGLHLGNACSIA